MWRFLFLVFFSLQAQAATVALSFDRVPLVNFLEATYRHMLSRDYVIDPALLKDDRKVSIQVAKIDTAALPSFLDRFLKKMGISASAEKGVYYFSELPPVPVHITPDFSPAPVAQVSDSDDSEPFLYRPQYREVPYLLDLVSVFVPGKYSQGKAKEGGDVLLYQGPVKRIEALQKLLAKLDIAAGEVVLRGMVYEVTKTDRNASAVNVAASLLDNKLSLSYGNGAPLSNALRFKGSNLDAIASALATDSRFKVLSSPSLRVRSGALGRFSVGQEVPVLGALTFPQGAAQPIQSVEYRSSGVIFEVRPQVRGAVVDLSVHQQLSNFVRTETGVDNSPTLIKREVKTDLSLVPADVVVLGGLIENKDSANSAGLPFLPRWLRTRGIEATDTEILLVFQVDHT